MPWTLPEVKDRSIQDRCDRVYAAAGRLARHMLGLLHPWKGDPTMMLVGESGSAEGCVRPSCGTVAGLAFLYRFGPYDSQVVGLSRAELLNRRIVPMFRYLTATHVTGPIPTSDGRNWGDHWQSAHWTDSLALAAWWVGADLPPDLAAAVRRVAVHEAERMGAINPPHQLKDDTKAEENAWNSEVFSSAVVLMPGDPRRQRWEELLGTWVFSSFLREADRTSPAMVDGRRVSERFTGANIFDDFTLENHHIVHPDYMTTFSLSLGCAIEHALTLRRPPEALLYNVPGIYENEKWFTMPDGGFCYPSGQDWSVYRQIDWLYPNVLMAVFGRDAEAWSLFDVCLEVLEKMQARTGSGSIYLPEENFFASAEGDKMSHLGRIWLALHFAGEARPVALSRLGVRRLEQARIILNRTPAAVHTFSWGTRCMAQCLPMARDRLISPDDRNGVGAIFAAGERRPLPLSRVDVQVAEEPKGFTARLVVDHGQRIRADLTYVSAADGTWSMRERLTALTAVSTDRIATGRIGILNDQAWIYQAGRRVIRFDGQTREIRSCSGEQLNGEGVREIEVDGVLHIRAGQPLQARYQAARGRERSRATDELSLNCIAGRRDWKAGETISEFQVVVRCTPREAGG
jgi:hypothetical protein